MSRTHVEVFPSNRKKSQQLLHQNVVNKFRRQSNIPSNMLSSCFSLELQTTDVSHEARITALEENGGGGGGLQNGK